MSGITKERFVPVINRNHIRAITTTTLRLGVAMLQIELQMDKLCTCEVLHCQRQYANTRTCTSARSSLHEGSFSRLRLWSSVFFRRCCKWWLPFKFISCCFSCRVLSHPCFQSNSITIGLTRTYWDPLQTLLQCSCCQLVMEMLTKQMRKLLYVYVNTSVLHHRKKTVNIAYPCKVWHHCKRSVYRWQCPDSGNSTLFTPTRTWCYGGQWSWTWWRPFHLVHFFVNFP